jgi:hypothetical protein
MAAGFTSTPPAVAPASNTTSVSYPIGNISSFAEADNTTVLVADPNAARTNAAGFTPLASPASPGSPHSLVLAPAAVSSPTASAAAPLLPDPTASVEGVPHTPSA